MPKKIFLFENRLFGFMMLGAEMNNKILQQYCQFLFNHLGRGLFNIL